MENNNEKNVNTNENAQNNENKKSVETPKKKGFDIKRILIDVGLVAGGGLAAVAVCYFVGASKVKSASNAAVAAIEAAV